MSFGCPRMSSTSSSKQCSTLLIPWGHKKSELSFRPQEVADLLNVSRPFVIKLIETRQLKAFKVGSHRRVLKAETLAFRQKMRNQKNEALDALVAGTERLELDFK